MSRNGDYTTGKKYTIKNIVNSLALIYRDQ